MSLLQTHGVSVEYDSRRVLDRVDLTIEPTTRTALTGRSGSGKTSLLLVLAGLLDPTSGRVDRHVADREVVYVPQAPSLIPELSALENTALALRLRGVSPTEATTRAQAELALFGLADSADALPSELSGGMQQRVALARATVVQPRLLLADEPTGALDHATGARVLTVLIDQATLRGSALVIATHDLEVAAALPLRLSVREGTVAA